MNGTEIAIVMAKQDDIRVMRGAAEVMDQFGLPYEMEILDFHHSPDRVINYAKRAHTRGIQVIIAGASGSAQLPGIVASLTLLPVIGVPIEGHNSIDGVDAIYSILQLPVGVPVATMGLNAAGNAALFALQILACKHHSYHDLVYAYKLKMKQQAEALSDKLGKIGYEEFFDIHK